MPRFSITRLPDTESTVRYLNANFDKLELQPSYQRQSEIWGEEKRQLFIDSLLNSFDLPKLYFHEVGRKDNKSARYAIVDGKQRLEAVRGFIQGTFRLSQDFIDEYASDPDRAGRPSGLSFEELSKHHSALATRLLNRVLHVEVIRTKDIEIIEELFSRLNEAAPLNAPEKRNAFGGEMPSIIRDLVGSHEFFTDRLPIENTRYRQYDLVTKFLFLTDRNDFVATKKRALDDFVKLYKTADTEGKRTTARELQQRVTTVLDAMAKQFVVQDSLLGSVGLVTVYYMAFLRAESDEALKSRLVRESLGKFDQLRRENRLQLRKEQAAIAKGEKAETLGSIRRDLAIFDRLMQSPNDGQALEYRFKILRAFLENKEFLDDLPSELSRRVGDM